MSGLNFQIAATLLPWAFSGILIFGLGLLAWKIGLPAVRIAALEQHIKLLDAKLDTARETALAAEEHNKRLQKQIVELMTDLTTANMRISAFLTIVELKQGMTVANIKDVMHMPYSAKGAP